MGHECVRREGGRIATGARPARTSQSTIWPARVPPTTQRGDAGLKSAAVTSDWHVSAYSARPSALGTLHTSTTPALPSSSFTAAGAPKPASTSSPCTGDQSRHVTVRPLPLTRGSRSSSSTVRSPAPSSFSSPHSSPSPSSPHSASSPGAVDVARARRRFAPRRGARST